MCVCVTDAGKTDRVDACCWTVVDADGISVNSKVFASAQLHFTPWLGCEVLWMCLYVCMSKCLSVSSLTSLKNCTSRLHKFSVHVTCGWLAMAYSCDDSAIQHSAFYTYSFITNVIFLHNWAYLDKHSWFIIPGAATLTYFVVIYSGSKLCTAEVCCPQLPCLVFTENI